MSFFRYPGGKSKLRNQIIDKLNKITQGIDFEYREPFFGGGSIGLKLLKDGANINRLWFNDLDIGIYCLWLSVIKYPELLKQKILSFVPSVQAFYLYKEELAIEPNLIDIESIVTFGFKKLAIHQISYSGLGTKSGGPLGGKFQKSNYKIDCRWSAKYICKKIDFLHEKFSQLNVKCSNSDFSEIILNNTENAVIYLDPPYFVKGNDLYQHGFTLKDHERLVDCLRKTKHKWLLSYDDCDEIRHFYSWANIEKIDGISYSITALKDNITGKRMSRTKSELLITPKGI